MLRRSLAVLATSLLIAVAAAQPGVGPGLAYDRHQLDEPDRGRPEVDQHPLRQARRSTAW